MPGTLENWMNSYRRAWQTNEPDDIRSLFAETAEYRTEPYAEPWVGHDEIIAGWLEAADDPGDWNFDWQVVVESADLGIVQGATGYAEGPDYNNLWVVRFAPDGRATSFTEWWMPLPDGGA